MSLASLLVIPDNPVGQATFGFEHAMAHRGLLGAMAPLDRFSVIPYFIHPQTLPSGGWRMDHQQAHDDFRVNLPVFWGWYQIGTEEYGVGSGQSLQDIYSQDHLQWWTFVNNMDHYVAANLLPLEFELTFPFW